MQHKPYFLHNRWSLYCRARVFYCIGQAPFRAWLRVSVHQLVFKSMGHPCKWTSICQTFFCQTLLQSWFSKLFTPKVFTVQYVRTCVVLRKVVTYIILYACMFTCVDTFIYIIIHIHVSCVVVLQVGQLLEQTGVYDQPWNRLILWFSMVFANPNICIISSLQLL